MYHDFSKGASPEDFVDLVLLFRVGRMRLRHYLLEGEREHNDGLIAVAGLSYPKSVVVLSGFRG